MYKGLGVDNCELAWKITEQTVLHAAKITVANKRAGTIVVCTPRTISGSEFDVAYMANVAPDHPDSEKYAHIALEKAKVSWKTGLPSRKVQQDAPFLYTEGMTKWGGSVIENGLIVAYSGVQAVFDEAIAGTMLRWIVALCQDEMTREGGVMDMNTSFIGEHPSDLT